MKKATMIVLAALVLAVLLLVVNKRLRSAVSVKLRSVVPRKVGFPPAARYKPDFVHVDLDLTQTPTFKEIFDLDIDVDQFGIKE